MIKQARRLVVLALLVPAAAATVALASGPLKGATYTGTIVHGKAAITLKVAKNGKSVTVNVLSAPLYCQGGGAPERQLTKGAPISKSGSFKGAIAYEFAPTHKITARLYFSGKFSGRTVKGSARSEFTLAHGCNGSTSFTAQAK